MQEVATKLKRQVKGQRTNATMRRRLFPLTGSIFVEQIGNQSKLPEHADHSNAPSV